MNKMKTFTDIKKLNENVDLTSNISRPKTLPTDVSETLNERLGDEYTAYYFYRNAANWCKNYNYKKAATFFENEASGELSHAGKIQDFLISWNLIPMIPVAPTQVAFESLVDIINKAYTLEYNLLLKYSQDQKDFFEIHPVSFNFIQEYVNIQNGEVSEYSDYLNALELIDVTNHLDILYFENQYFG